MTVVSLVAYVISVAVPAFAIYLVFALDLFGTGKTNTVFSCLGWGIFGAFGLAFGVNTSMQRVLDLDFETLSTRTAPVAEELIKAFILLYIVQQPRFRYFVDGAIYGFAAGIGFAMSENIFYVANDVSGAALSLAVGRVLSASLMHATASSVFGISLGLSRRSAGVKKYIIPFLGIFFAIVVHFIYNNLLNELGGGAALLLVGMGIGLGGGILIAIFISQGLDAEKKRFEETLGLSSGVSSAERKAVQQLGSEAIEEILEEMSMMFGEEKADLIRQLLVVQANIGILKNNLNSPVNDRLREAWQKEIDLLRSEMDDIRSHLGPYTMTLLRSLLPEDDTAVWNDFNTKVAEYDPTHVHSFDLFMVASELSGTISPEQLEKISNRLHKMEIFKHVDLADLDNLSRAISIRHFSHGEMIFDKGATGDAMYLIDRGYIDIFTLAVDGQQKLLRTYQASDVVGELALLDGQTRSARARANGPLKVMILQRKHFMMFIQSRPKVILAVLRFLADRVRYTTDAVTGDSVQQTIVPIMTEDTGPITQLIDVAPHETDTVTGKSALGVFGRLTDALNRIEQEKQTDD